MKRTHVQPRSAANVFDAFLGTQQPTIRTFGRNSPAIVIGNFYVGGEEVKKWRRKRVEPPPPLTIEEVIDLDAACTKKPLLMPIISDIED
jgi:hypothetical protein